MLIFSGSSFPLGHMRILRDQTGSGKHARWRPVNFDCVYLCLQTRYKQNFIGFTYFSGSSIPLGLMRIENTMWPYRKWKKSRWRPLNFKCVSLRSQTRCQRNSNGYTYVFEVQHFTGTCGNDVRPNRKWKAQNVLQMREYLTCTPAMTPIW